MKIILTVMSKSLNEAFMSTVSLVPLAPVLEFFVYLLIDVTLKSIQIYGKVAKIAQKDPIFLHQMYPGVTILPIYYCYAHVFLKSSEL